MTLRGLYTLVGLAWGLLLGVTTLMLVSALGLGVSWLYLFGDDPWPGSAGLVVFSLGATGGILVFVACLVTARRWAQVMESQDAGAQKRSQRSGLILISVALLLGVLLAGAAWQRDRAIAEEREARMLQYDTFVALAREVQRIDAIAVQSEPGDEIAVALAFNGERGGAYRLAWALEQDTYDKALITGTINLMMESGNNTHVIIWPLEQITEAYRDRILNGGGGVLVEEDLVFTAELQPYLTEIEAEELPASEMQNLQLGHSGLIDRKTTPVAVTFTLP